MKKTLTTLLPLLFAALALTGCDPQEANSQRDLEYLLNSEEGQRMTADELANMSRSGSQKMKGAGIEVHLPVTSADTRPVAGTAYIAEDSTSLVFTLYDATDTLNTVGTVDVEWHQDHWGNSHRSGQPPVSASYYVQSRGKGIYTFYSYQKEYDNYGNAVLDADGNAVTNIFFEGMLVFVYPDADSLLITRGHPDTEHTYRSEK